MRHRTNQLLERSRRSPCRAGVLCKASVPLPRTNSPPWRIQSNAAPNSQNYGLFFLSAPRIVESQIVSGIVFGLTAALWGKVTIVGGQVQQTNCNNYRVLRGNEMPEIEVHLVDSDEAPGGIGEPAVALVAPARAADLGAQAAATLDYGCKSDAMLASLRR